ncbi:AbrB/MazE/SpoVT family DNA-binding domain-containing protein [Campylobacter upsaliensis]|nr:AbrB/MazE/SpoVT family DNA-binding domain-containing protein [Campylobacter upsaliensis]
MMTYLKLSKWGNSLALRIPVDMLNDLNISQDTKLELYSTKDKLILKKCETLDDLCCQITNTNLNIDNEWINDSVGKEW